eukprot:2008000-Rhodomonas_salina.4
MACSLRRLAFVSRVSLSLRQLRFENLTARDQDLKYSEFQNFEPDMGPGARRQAQSKAGHCA